MQKAKKHTSAFVMLLLLTVFIVPVIVKAAPGDPDPSFDGDGVAMFYNTAGFRSTHGNGITLDENGKILVTGRAYDLQYNEYMIVLRYNQNGTLDTSFNGTGIFSIRASAGGNDEGLAITTDSNGRIIVSGTSWDSMQWQSFTTVWRLNPNGTLDTTFDYDGMYTYYGGNHGWGYAITVDSTDHILVTGSVQFVGGARPMPIIKLTESGNLDTTFGNGGIATAFGKYGKESRGYSIIIDQNNKLLVSGYSEDNYKNDAMTTWRFNQDGTIDTSFGSNGMVTYQSNIGKNFYKGAGITYDENGKIYVVGLHTNYGVGRDMVLWRYNQDGTLDQTFNSDGVAIYQGTHGGITQTGNGITLDNNGRIIVAGSAWNDQNRNLMTIWRINPDGTLDTTFSEDGASGNYQGTSGHDDLAMATVVIDENGNVLTTGGTGSVMKTIRVEGDPVFTEPVLDEITDVELVSGDTLNGNFTFSDPGTTNTHIATIDFGTGDGPKAATVNFINGVGTITGSKQYFAPGTYTSEVCVTNNYDKTDCEGFMVTVTSTPLPEEVELIPGSNNKISCNNENRVIPVTLYTTLDFDATQVDPATVTLSGAQVTQSGNSGNLNMQVEDVDLDGDLDMVLHFRVGETDLTCESEMVTLVGRMLDGSYFEGAEVVEMVSKGKPKK